ncbi:MAG TPA: hypothetical protein VHC90_13605 [Bryobacteraceae bacterium]|nr:hypothetical protein [Bryobacteraceae bacterium]
MKNTLTLLLVPALGLGLSPFAWGQQNMTPGNQPGTPGSGLSAGHGQSPAGTGREEGTTPVSPNKYRHHKGSTTAFDGDSNRAAHSANPTTDSERMGSSSGVAPAPGSTAGASAPEE